LLVAIGLAAACNSDDVGGTDAGETGETGEAAQGSVAVSMVELNPGVPIPVIVDGEVVPAFERAGQIPRDRPALLRVHLDVTDDWTARDVELRLVLEDGQGNMGERMQTLFVIDDTEPGDLDTSFDFELVNSEVSPGLSIALELRDSAAADDAEPVRIPAEGVTKIGVEDDPLVMRVMFAPVAYNSGTCTSDATPTDEEREAFVEAIYQNFPVQTVETAVRAEPIVWNEELDSNWSGLLQKMLDHRELDQVPDDAYYIGLVDFCDEDPFVSAVAAGFPSASPDAAGVRVAISSKYPVPQGGGGINGVLFSLGVLHGRLTVPCATGAGLDEAYPYPGGSIGHWGYGVLDKQLRDPAKYVDLVAGCMSPTRGVSDYTWRGLYERVRVITSWAG
jgi:hypothetical protein